MAGNQSLVPARGRRGELITGRFEGHGKANYQFEPDGSPSYYVKLVTGRGAETLWGTDLERAITRSKTQPKVGTLVGVRRTGSEAVTIPARKGEPTTDRERTFHRARWEVESVGYFAQSMQRARRDLKAQIEDGRALRERPELRSSFVSLKIAQKFAEERIRDPQDRLLFIQRVREVMTLSARNAQAAAPAPRTEAKRPASLSDATQREDLTR